MAKKIDSSSKPTVPEKAPATTKAPIATKAPAKAPAKRKVVARRTTKVPAKKTAKPAAVAKTPKPAGPTFTRDEIALRAYFIAEKRHAHGLPGNEHQDWVEAERQLLAETRKRKPAKKV